ncbi:MAG: Ig-like domain-containing protein [Thermoleophilia bacterium]
MGHNRMFLVFALLCCLSLAVAVPGVAATLAAPEYQEIEIIVTPPDQINPGISGNYVIWQDYRNKSYGCPSAQNCLGADVFSRNLTTGVEQRLTLTSFAMDPDIDGNYVVWRNWSNGKIVAHNLATGTQQYTSLLANDPTNYKQMTQPAVDGNIVVWTDYRTSSDYGNIYMRDLGQSADVPVSVASTDPAIPAVKKDKRNPDIDGNIVVWEDMRNAFQDSNGWWHNPDIYMKNLTTGVEQAVTTNTGDQYYPVVAGNKVYWSDYRNGNWDIYMYDIATGVESRISESAYDQNWPSFDGDSYAWKESRLGVEDIFIGRLSTGEKRQLTADSAAQKLPAMNGGRIVWMDNRNGNWDIFMAQLDTVAPVISAAGPGGVIATASTTLTASYSDGQTAIDTATVVVALDGSAVACTVTASGASCPVAGLSDGVHAITVDVKDMAGNPATRWSGSFTVDTTGPVVSALSAAAPPDSDTATITAAYNDAYSSVDAGSVQLRVDGTLASGCTVSAASLSCAVSGQALGSHGVELSLSDSLGNPTLATTSFSVVDTRAPIITGTGPTGILNSSDQTLTASFSDNSPSSGVDPASVVVKLDGTAVSGCVANAGGVSCGVSDLPDAVHNAEVAVRDLAGNASSSTWSFTMSASGPVIDQLTPGNGGIYQGPKATVSARVTDFDGVDTDTLAIYFQDVDVTGDAVINGEVIAYEAQGLTDGPYTVKVTASDLAGHPAEQIWTFTVTTPRLLLDKVAVYWESYAAYLDRELTVDYRMTSNGSGACNSGVVNNAVATNGVIAFGPLPVLLGTLAPDSISNYSFVYIVPHGVSNFRATSYAACAGDDGHSFLFPEPPPL